MTRQELELMITKEVAKQVRTILPALIKEAINPSIIKRVVADSFTSIIMESTGNTMPVRPTGNSAKRTALTEGAVAYEEWPEMDNVKAMTMMGYNAPQQRALLTVDSMIDGLSPAGQPVPINRVPEYTQRALNAAATGDAKKFLDKMNEFTARKRGR